MDDPDERPDDAPEPDDDEITQDLPSVDDVGPADAGHGPRRGHGPGGRGPGRGHPTGRGREGAAHLRRRREQGGAGRAYGRSGYPSPGPARTHGRGGRSVPPPRRPTARPREEMVVDSVGIAAEAPSGVRPPGRRYLLDSERRIIFVRRHPAILLRYVLETLGALVLAGVLTAHLPDDLVLLDVLWYGVLFVMARMLYHVAEWSVDRLVVTDRRMMLVTGLFTRKVAMMPLVKVTDMTYERSVTGRVLGYGEFIMESAGQDQALSRVRYVPAPDRLYRKVSELLFGGYQGSPAPPYSGQSSSSDE